MRIAQIHSNLGKFSLYSFLSVDVRVRRHHRERCSSNHMCIESTLSRFVDGPTFDNAGNSVAVGFDFVLSITRASILRLMSRVSHVRSLTRCQATTVHRRRDSLLNGRTNVQHKLSCVFLHRHLSFIDDTTIL